MYSDKLKLELYTLLSPVYVVDGNSTGAIITVTIITANISLVPRKTELNLALVITTAGHCYRRDVRMT